MDRKWEKRGMRLVIWFELESISGNTDKKINANFSVISLNRNTNLFIELYLVIAHGHKYGALSETPTHT